MTATEILENGEIFGTVARLADLVDYQNGSVVSRAIVKKDTGSVTLFAFDKGEGLSEHTAPFDALVFVVEGEAEIALAGEAHAVRSGEVLGMPANKPHSLRAVKRFKMMLMMFRS